MLTLPLALGFFLVPLPASLATPLGLPVTTAAGAETLLELLGIPVLRLQTVLMLRQDIYAVSDRCSGFSALYAALGFALVLAVYTRSWTRRGLLLLSVWPLAAFFSALRTAVLIAVCDYLGVSVLFTGTHGISGIFAFWAVLLVLLLLAGPRQLRASFA